MRRTVGFLLAMIVSSSTAAGDKMSAWIERTSVSGEFFADAYFMATNHDEEVDGANGLWIRRINLSLDSILSESFSSRLRFEMNSSGDFETSQVMTPYVKDAWLKWRGDSTSVMFGLFGTSTWNVVEDVWGYRSIEKSPVELHRFGSSRDMGVAVDGKGAGGKVYYNLMVGNGANTTTESNDGKKLYAAFGFRPRKPWVIEAYADFEARPDDADRTTVQGFVGFKSEGRRFGVVAARQVRSVADGDDLELDLVALFAVRKVHDKLTLLARYDRMLDPNPEGDRVAYLPFATRGEPNLLIVAGDIELVDAVHLIPNVELVWYGGTDAPDRDVMLRLTGSWRF